jgi:regulator of RNase E activity RraA
MLGAGAPARPIQGGEMSDPELLADLRGVTTATLTTVLLKRGLRRVWIAGAFPLAPAGRIAGPAFTMRFVPGREDLATPAAWASPRSTRAAIEDMPEGCVAVIDARGIREAGVFGDILCARMHRRGVAGLVTDGVLRDLEGTLATGLPIWASGQAAPASVAAMHFVGWGEVIGCGGVCVEPGDIVVADRDGAVVVPAAIAGEVRDAALEQERLEGWIMREVERGVPLPGLYPPDEETRARYEAERERD